MATPAELESAFDEAIAQARKCLAAGMTTINGDDAQPQLEHLAGELSVERERALERRAIDRVWVQKTVRWLVEWTPESDLTLIAALGRIARVAPTVKP
ncbi:MAG TPA: hypothetical protein VIH53_10015 [Gemmatimonadaceae bacterium]